MTEVLLIIINYLAGSISSAILITKYVKKVDIRSIGYQTAGGSNVAQNIGKGWGLAVMIFDLLKGMPVILLAKYLQVEDIWIAVIATAGIAGHCWPIFFNFSGGRGLAVFAGAAIALHPLYGIITLLAFIVTLPLFIIKKKGVITSPLISSPFVTLLALGLFIFLSYCSNNTALLLYGVLGIGIILVRRVSAQPTDYTNAENKYKLFLSRLFFDSNDVIT